MEKINFVNGQSPYISATNLNNLQDNVENAINGIIESGSNANGNYIKYADGTMICRKKMDFGKKAVSNPWGSLYESEELDIGNYPQAFIETPVISVMPLDTFFVEKNGSNVSKTGWGSFWAVRPVSVKMSIAVDCIAIGKWK